jgi:preprotein translocase subunit SecY
MFKIPELRKRILFTLALLAVYRIGCFITTPGVDRLKMNSMFGGDSQGMMSLFNFFSGGALEQMSIFALGIMPYISASIIFQLLGVVVPAVERKQKEGESGRRAINQWTRYLTLGISLVQGFLMATWLLNQSSSGDIAGLVTIGNEWGFKLLTILSLTTGAVFIMWLGEQINDRGIGNGISLVIFAGIVARLPNALYTLVQQAIGDTTGTVGLSGYQIILLTIVVTVTIAFICFFEKAQRRIPIQHAKRMVGRDAFSDQASYLPLKLNTAGVIPPIFASSILMFPATIAGMFPNIEWLQSMHVALMPGDWRHILFYVALIVFFCFFYTAVVFNPVDVADNLKKNQASIPGVRPGKTTAEYIETALDRVTVVGAIYISLVCILPELLVSSFQVQFYFGGTSLLIVVGVSLDTVRQIEDHLTNRHYEGFNAPTNRPRLRQRAAG